MRLAGRKIAFVVAMGAITAMASASDQDGLPYVFRKLLACRSVPEAVARLACYDEAVSAIDTAQRKKDLVVVDRQQVRETRRSLFGFPIPQLGIFSRDKDDASNEVAQIEGTVVSASGSAGGNIRILLADGAGTWEATSGIDVVPRRGDKAVIRRGALGSYLAVIGINRGVRMRRVE